MSYTMANLGHPNNLQPIGQISDVSTGKVDVIADTSKRIIGMLDEQDMISFEQGLTKFHNQIKELADEVDLIKSQLGYNYIVEDYIKRVSQGNELFDLTLEELLDKYPKLNGIFQNILSEFVHKGSINTLKILIIEEYLLELVYLTMNRRKLADPDVITPVRKHVFFLNKGMMHIIQDNPEEFNAYIHGYNNCKILALVFYDADISLLTDEQLELLFSSFRDIRVISAQKECFERLNLEQSMIVSKYLVNIKGLDVSFSFFYGTNAQSLNNICLHLTNLEYFNFGNNSIYHSTMEKIHAIFDNLKSLKHISLQGVELGILQEIKIDAVFSNFSSVETIDLIHCKLSYLDNHLLRRLIKHLVNIKRVLIYDNNFDDDQIRLVKSLLPNSEVII